MSSSKKRKVRLPSASQNDQNNNDSKVNQQNLHEATNQKVKLSKAKTKSKVSKTSKIKAKKSSPVASTTETSPILKSTRSRKTREGVKSRDLSSKSRSKEHEPRKNSKHKHPGTNSASKSTVKNATTATSTSRSPSPPGRPKSGEESPFFQGKSMSTWTEFSQNSAHTNTNTTTATDPTMSWIIPSKLVPQPKLKSILRSTSNHSKPLEKSVVGSSIKSSKIGQKSSNLASSNRFVVLYKIPKKNSRQQHTDSHSTIQYPSESPSTYFPGQKGGENDGIKNLGQFRSLMGLEKEMKRAKEKLGGGINLAVREIQRVENAIRDGHVFEVRGGAISGGAEVREELLKRGWVDKTKPSKLYSPPLNFSNKRSNQDPNVLKSQSTDSCNWPLVRRLLDRQLPNLIWTDHTHKICWSCIPPGTLINRNPEGSHAYTLKKNMVEPIQNIHWLGTKPGTSSSSFIRTYRLFVPDEKAAFLQDYKLTACQSLVKWFVSIVDGITRVEGNAEASVGVEGVTHFATGVANAKQQKLNEGVEISTVLPLVDFALAQVKNYVRVRKHEDIDDPEELQKKTTKKREMTWDSFFKHCHKILHSTGIKNDKNEGSIKKVVRPALSKAKELLHEVSAFWPQFHIDGVLNVWIFKPGQGTQGRGIVILDKYEEIVSKFIKGNNEQSSFIAQKYIERPLLVYQTKFDIRQWFLILSWNPLQAFIYKHSYLRFSGKTFNLDDLHESIHLTNKDVQQRYPIDPARNPNISLNNMWTSQDFQNYLKKIGEPTIWNKKIYPAMKKALVTFLLATRESVVDRPGSFLIQGADFMISDDFTPWLIELNSNPVMATSTTVKSKLTPKCIQDALKVILDWNGEGHTDIGDFEVLYHGKARLVTPSISLKNLDASSDYLIQGEKLPMIPAPEDMTKSTDKKSVFKKRKKKKRIKSAPSQLSSETKKTLFSTKKKKPVNISSNLMQ